MKKHFVILALLPLIWIAGCASNSSSVHPVTLPATLFDTVLQGNHVTVSLHSDCEDFQSAYCYRVAIDADQGPGGRLRTRIIQRDLPNGYPGHRTTPWNELIGDNAGSGYITQGAGPHEFNLRFYEGPHDTIAVFLDVQTLTTDNRVLSGTRLGPIVIQRLPDDQGLAIIDGTQ